MIDEGYRLLPALVLMVLMVLVVLLVIRLSPLLKAVHLPERAMPRATPSWLW